MALDGGITIDRNLRDWHTAPSLLDEARGADSTTRRAIA